MATRTLADILPPDRNGFGPLRLALALAVIVSHCYLLTTGTNASEPLFNETGLTLGQHAVQVFFVLSGVMVAASLATAGSLGQFIAARLLRVMPALIVCVALTAFAIGPLMTALPIGAYLRDPATYLYVLKTAALTTGQAPLPGVFIANPMAGEINIPIYTLKYEVICYALLAAAGASGLMRSRRAMIGAGVLLALAYVARQALADPTVSGGSLDLMLRFLFCFALGVAAFEARGALKLHVAGVAGLLLAYALAHGTRFEVPVLILFVGYSALWLGQFRFGILHALTSRADLSYGLYIWGWVVTQALVDTYPAITPMPLLAMTLAVVVPVAAASWFLIERPALALKSRFRQGRRLLPSPAGKVLALSETVKHEEDSMSYSTSTAAKARLQRITAKPANGKPPARPAAAASPKAAEEQVPDENAPAPFPVDGIARSRLTRIAKKPMPAGL